MTQYMLNGHYYNGHVDTNLYFMLKYDQKRQLLLDFMAYAINTPKASNLCPAHTDRFFVVRSSEKK